MITKNINKVGKVNFHEDFKQDVFEYRHNKFSQLIPKDSIVLDIGGDIGSESHFDLEYYPGEGKITYEDWLKKMEKINKEDMLKKIQKIILILI